MPRRVCRGAELSPVISCGAFAREKRGEGAWPWRCRRHAVLLSWEANDAGAAELFCRNACGSSFGATQAGVGSAC